MKTTTLDRQLIEDIISAHRDAVNYVSRNGVVNFKNGVNAIEDMKETLEYVIKAKYGPRSIRYTELKLAFVRDIHKQNLDKYESYRRSKTEA